MTSDEHPQVQTLEWAAATLLISLPTAYRMAQNGELPGALKVGGQWRISVPKFNAAVHGSCDS